MAACDNRAPDVTINQWLLLVTMDEPWHANHGDDRDCVADFQQFHPTIKRNQSERPQKYDFPLEERETMSLAANCQLLVAVLGHININGHKGRASWSPSISDQSGSIGRADGDHDIGMRQHAAGGKLTYLLRRPSARSPISQCRLTKWPQIGRCV